MISDLSYFTVVAGTSNRANMCRESGELYLTGNANDRT